MSALGTVITIDLDPILLRVGHIALSWYGLASAATVAVILFVWTFGPGRILMRVFSSKDEIE